MFTTRRCRKASCHALSDGPNGVRKQAARPTIWAEPQCACHLLPTSATVANSWDPELGEAVGAAMGEEAAAQGVSVLLGPGLNIKRSPCAAAPRVFLEDLPCREDGGVAYVRGDPGKRHCRLPQALCREQSGVAPHTGFIVDERTLVEIYLTGFRWWSRRRSPRPSCPPITVNGTYANENAHLLMDILRKDWGFDGAVVTDWGGSNDHALA